MKFLIISGMSGAGKSRVADILEDMNYYCVDNMPAALLPKLAEFCMGMGSRYEKVALVTDIRDKDGVDTIFDSLDKLWELGCDCEILFVEADKATIIKRQKESRRPHPLQAEAGSLEAAIDLEIHRMERLRDSADYVINTSSLTLGKLQKQIAGLFGAPDGVGRQISVSVMSFGFKYGIPMESDLVLDVRFLANPFYVAELRPLSGMDEPVYAFVMQQEQTKEFAARLFALVDFLLPQYIEEGKRTLTIAVGCTGGRHRSVVLARALADHINAAGQSAELINRDLEK